METVLTFVGEDVDSSEGLEGDLNLFLGLAVFHQDNTTEDAKTILGHIFVKLQLLTGGSDS